MSTGHEPGIFGFMAIFRQIPTAGQETFPLVHFPFDCLRPFKMN